MHACSQYTRTPAAVLVVEVELKIIPRSRFTSVCFSQAINSSSNGAVTTFSLLPLRAAPTMIPLRVSYPSMLWCKHYVARTYTAAVVGRRKKNVAYLALPVLACTTRTHVMYIPGYIRTSYTAADAAAPVFLQ